MNIIKTSNLTKKFGNSSVVDDVNMTINYNDIYGLIGKNGAGKTTLMKLLVGLSKQTSGDICFYDNKGNSISNCSIGCIIETPALFPDMTALKNMQIQSDILGTSGDGIKKIENVLELVGLKSSMKKKVKYYSLGMKQRLGIALALLGEPSLLVLDEPINGLDPIGIKEVRELLISIHKEKEIAILISSHILGELEMMINKMGIMKDGKLIREIGMQELKKELDTDKNLEEYIISQL